MVSSAPPSLQSYRNMQLGGEDWLHAFTPWLLGDRYSLTRIGVKSVKKAAEIYQLFTRFPADLL
jgi:hypothetical protein